MIDLHRTNFMDLLVADLLLVGVTLSSSVLLHLVGFDAETLDIVLPVVDQELHTRRDGLADPKVL